MTTTNTNVYCMCGSIWRRMVNVRQASQPARRCFLLLFFSYHKLVLLVDGIPLGLESVQELSALHLSQLLQVFVAIADLLLCRLDKQKERGRESFGL